jgi:RNA polymerase sigma factor (sigma-70 family)
MSKETFRLTITARLRNGYIWEAAQKLGSARALADHLGVTQKTIGEWMNMRKFPRDKTLRGRLPEIAAKLEKLCEAPIEEIFPENLKIWADVLAGERAITKEIPVGLLLESPQRFLPAPQDQQVEQREMRDKIRDVLERLKPMQRECISLYYGLEGNPMTLEEIGQIKGLTREMIRMHIKNGLSIIRKKENSLLLKGFF